MLNSSLTLIKGFAESITLFPLYFFCIDFNVLQSTYIKVKHNAIGSEKPTIFNWKGPSRYGRQNLPGRSGYFTLYRWCKANGYFTSRHGTKQPESRRSQSLSYSTNIPLEIPFRKQNPTISKWHRENRSAGSSVPVLPPQICSLISLPWSLFKEPNAYPCVRTPLSFTCKTPTLPLSLISPLGSYCLGL